MVFPDLESAIAAVPAGRYAVGVSGGADSVALLTLLVRHRPDIAVHVAHLDHEWRGRDSADDAAFVAALADRLGVPCATARRHEIESSAGYDPPQNLEARGRTARLEIFRRVVVTHQLAGVLLAHHRDDQAETVLLRLLRGSAATLRGMRSFTLIAGLAIRRPLLGIPRQRLREWLTSIGQPFREDATNADHAFARNRVRNWLVMHPATVDPLVSLANALQGWNDWADKAAPDLPAEFDLRQLTRQPVALARRAATRWLIRHAGCPVDLCDIATADRLIHMCRDAASSPRADYPGGVKVRRRGGVISAVRPGA